VSPPRPIDRLREFADARHIRDSEACGVIARDLRAVVAEYDAARAEMAALRGAVRRVAAAERALTDDGDLRSAAAKRLDRDAALLALFALVPADREAAP